MLDDPLIGYQLANFRIERALGRGGMAQVYYGQDVKLQRPVAIKVIDARFRDNPVYAQRFVREAQAIAKWRHEQIVQIYYADDQAGLYYFVMEYIDGQDLGQFMAQYVARGELVPQAEVLRIGQAVASALDYAHRRGVIHRDVKPSNVLIANEGRVVLADFGLAMEVEQGSVGEAFGSANYVAPEQARRSSDAVPQSDLYSLGIMLYEMLTGQVPFDDPSSTAVAIQHLTLPPPPPRELNPALNEATEAVLLKALSKLPGDRYQTGQAQMDALAGALQTGQPALAGQVEPPPTLPELVLPSVIVADPALVTSQGSSAERPVLSASEGPVLSSNQEPARTQWMAAPPLSGAPGPVSNQRPIYVSLGIGLMVIMLFICVLLSVLFLRLRGSSGEEIAAQVSPVVESEAIATVGVESNGTTTIEPTLIPTQAPPAVIPPTEPALLPIQAPAAVVENPAGYDFLIAKWDKESLFIVNLTAAPFPLAPLRLSNETGSINGTDWGVEMLGPGECVMAWKSTGHPRSPDVSCNSVGQQLVFEPRKRFWEETFEVNYDNLLIGICKKDQDECPFNTVTPFNGSIEEDDENKEEKKKKEEEGD